MEKKLEEMELKELKALATDMGLDFKKNAGKAKMISLLEANFEVPEEVVIPVAEGHSLSISKETLEAVAKDDLHNIAKILRNPETEAQARIKSGLSDEEFDLVKAKILEEDLEYNGDPSMNTPEEETEKLYLGKCVKTGKDLYR